MKLIFFALLLLCFFANLRADVAFVAADSNSDTSGASNITASGFAAGSTADGVIIACGHNSYSGDYILSATWDGNSGTSVSGGTAVTDGATAATVEMFYYFPGAASLTDTADAVCNYSDSDIGYRCIGVISFSGVDTADPVGTAGSSTTKTSPSTITITDGASGDMVVDTVHGWSQAITAGETSRWSEAPGSVDCFGQTQSGGASVAMDYTWSGTQSALAHQAVNINAAAAAGPSAALLRRRGR